MTSLTVSAAGAVVTVPIEEDDLVAAEDDVASSRTLLVAARRRALRHERRIVAHATSLPGTWSEDQVVPHHPELHFRVRAEQACAHFWKWRVQLRNDASEPLSLACALADRDEVCFRDVDRFVVAARGEVEAVFFFETQPKKEPCVVLGEMDR